ANVGGDDEVFVIGHAHGGMKVLADANKKTIDQTTIVERLGMCGLRKNVACKIVVYGCESAKGGTESLSAKVASSLKINEFVCAENVWGFTRRVSMKTHGNALCVDMNGTWTDYTQCDYAQVFI